MKSNFLPCALKIFFSISCSWDRVTEFFFSFSRIRQSEKKIFISFFATLSDCLENESDRLAGTAIAKLGIGGGWHINFNLVLVRNGFRRSEILTRDLINFPP